MAHLAPPPVSSGSVWVSPFRSKRAWRPLNLEVAPWRSERSCRVPAGGRTSAALQLDSPFRAQMKSLGRDRVKTPVCCCPTGNGAGAGAGAGADP